MKTRLFVLMLLLIIAACKKENQASQITFTLNGVNHSYSIASTAYDSISTITDSGLQEHTVGFGSVTSFYGIAISLTQILNQPGVAGFETGTYQNLAYDKACGYNGGHAGCHTFLIAYSDSVISLDNSPYDSTGVLNLTSYSPSKNLLSGTFQCNMADNNGHIYPLTNGQFTNIPVYVP